MWFFFVWWCPRNTISSTVFGFSPVPGLEDHFNSSLCWRIERVLTTFFVSTDHQRTAAFPRRSKIAIQPKFTGYLLHARPHVKIPGIRQGGKAHLIKVINLVMGVVWVCVLYARWSQSRGALAGTEHQGWPFGSGVQGPWLQRKSLLQSCLLGKLRDLLLMTLPLLRLAGRWAPVVREGSVFPFR